jgi:plasmid stabilization system protein ParE
MKRYAVVLQPRARAQIDEAKDWWEQRSPSQAEAIDDALEAAVALLSRFPEIGHPIQVRGGGPRSIASTRSTRSGTSSSTGSSTSERGSW